MSEDRLPERIGKYPVVNKLGEGATSEVYLCFDPYNDREVAVKRVFPEVLRDPSRGKVYRKLFFAEASLAGRLQHPHIVQIHDAGMDEHSGYIVMEYVAGGTLEAFAREGRLLTPDDIVEIAYKCTRALAYAQGLGVIHRDVKPGNILIGREPVDIKLSDFGLALASGTETTQVTGVGSPAYMSPEQVREDTLDFRTDMHSLGVVMYQLLTGRLPFQAGNNFGILYQIATHEPPPPSTLRPEVPPAIDRIVRRAMQKERDKRYASWEEFSEALTEAFGGTHAAAGETPGDSERFHLLRRLAFFARFSDPELWEVVNMSRWERVSAGTPVIRDGETGDFFCVLAEGSMHVSKHRKLLNVLRAGECFGEMAYLAGGNRTRGADVTAASDALLLTIGIADLDSAEVMTRSKFDRAFVALLVERLNLANARLAGV